MDIRIQIQAFNLIEDLLNNGSTLPITATRAEGILNLREQATGMDVELLSDALRKSDPVVENLSH